MIYFCADDYGISMDGNRRIEDCLEHGILNKVSVLPNGDMADIQHLSSHAALLSLHLNLIEGRPLSAPAKVDLLITNDGFFKYSFLGLFLLSLSPKRKALERQLYEEIQSQIRFWKRTVDAQTPVAIDSHQHTHMIPLVFNTLLRVIKDEALAVAYLRIPDEPLAPYIRTPSLFLSYSPTGLLKQWVLKCLALVTRKQRQRANIPSAYFMGVLFSGVMNETRIKKLLPHYLKLAEKNNKDIEIGFHPGYVAPGETLLCGSRKGFGKFYFSPWRGVEYDTLKKFKL